MRLLLSVTFLVFALTHAAAAEEPVVHMLVPGFTVRELPIHLSNINNLRFAQDGRLFALGYDGRIHILRDRNGDGLEDSDELFWGKPGISVPVGMALTPKVSTFPRMEKFRCCATPMGMAKPTRKKLLRAVGRRPTSLPAASMRLR